MRTLGNDLKVKVAGSAAVVVIVGGLLLGAVWRGWPPRGEEASSSPPRTPSSSVARSKPERLPTTGMSDAEEIERLLRVVQESGVTFIRNDVEYSGERAAEHLRRKLRASGLKEPTLDEFIELTASRSSITGKAYAVRLAGGTVMNAGDWLRQRCGEDSRLSEMRPEPHNP